MLLQLFVVSGSTTVFPLRSAAFAGIANETARITARSAVSTAPTLPALLRVKVLTATLTCLEVPPPREVIMSANQSSIMLPLL